MDAKERKQLADLGQLIKYQVIATKDHLNLAEASVYLGISQKAVMDLLHIRAIRYHAYAGNVFIRRRNLDRWMNGRPNNTVFAFLWRLLSRTIGWVVVLVKAEVIDFTG